MGVHDRDWWKEAHRKATYEPKQFRRPASGSHAVEATQGEARSTTKPRTRGSAQPSSLALVVATIVLLLIVVVVACLRRSHLL